MGHSANSSHQNTNRIANQAVGSDKYVSLIHEHRFGQQQQVLVGLNTVNQPERLVNLAAQSKAISMKGKAGKSSLAFDDDKTPLDSQKQLLKAQLSQVLTSTEKRKEEKLDLTERNILKNAVEKVDFLEVRNPDKRREYFQKVDFMNVSDPN